MSLLRDIRHATRALGSHAHSTLVAFLSLAIVLGLTTAVFSIVNAVLLRPFPYQNSERLFVMWGASSFDVRPGLDGHALERWRQRSVTVEDASVFQLQPSRFSLDRQGDSVTGALVGTRTFSVLGARAQLGRVFTGDDEAEDHVVVLSSGLWNSRFGGDPALVGQTVTIDGTPRVVIGVMPPGFFFPDTDRALWIPLTRRSPLFTQVHGVARLRAGIPLEQAQAELTTTFADGSQGPSEAGEVGAFELHRLIIREHGAASWTLLCATLLLVFAACVNTGNILVARRLSRTKELAVRVSLGARPSDLTILLIVEPVLLSVAAGAAGVVIAHGTLVGLQHAHLVDIPRFEHARVDWPVLVFAGVASLATAIVASVAPVLAPTVTDLSAALQTGGPATPPPAATRFRLRLLLMQVAITSMLLVGATLLVASFVLRSQSNWGFEPNGLFVAETRMAAATSSSHVLRSAFIDDVIERVRALPGVTDVAMATGVPARWNVWTIARLSVDGRLRTDFAASGWTVSPAYFSTMGIPVVAGREFRPADALGGERRVVVSRALASRLWRGREAIGREITLVRPTKEALAEAAAARAEGMSLRSMVSLLSPQSWEPDGAPWTVIGEVGDVKMFGLEASAPPALYFLHSQHAAVFRDVKLVVRGESVSELAVRASILDADPGARVGGTAMMADVIERSIGGRGSSRLMFVVSAAVALMSLLVISTGVFGTILFAVQQRTREVGIRRALGATGWQAVRPCISDIVRHAGAGLLLGFVGATFVTGTLTAFLFGVKPLEAWVFAAVACVVLGTAGLAMVYPSWTALQIDPAETLRRE